jgi:ribose 5-phosphate isomerase A
VNWETNAVYKWAGTISNRAAKEEAGRRVAGNVEDGQVIGVGSGSTALVAIQAIADRIRREGLRISAICTSAEVTLACAAAGIPSTSLLQRRPDWYFDGADEVDSARNMIKGRGGAMYMEKILMRSAPKTYILVDQSKLVSRLGEKFPVPVEVFPLALHLVERELLRLGVVDMAVRPAGGKDGPVISEHGNFILDVRFREIHQSLEADIKAITGVIESGLFMGYPVELLVAGS